MRFDLTCSMNWSASFSLLQGSLFHIRITPSGREKQISALDKYGYLETVPEEDPVSFENTEDVLKIKTSKGSLLFDKKQFFFELTDLNSKTQLRQTDLSFSDKCVSAAFNISPDQVCSPAGCFRRQRGSVHQGCRPSENQYFRYLFRYHND